jgi:alpha-1,3-glucosyltransferase
MMKQRGEHATAVQKPIEKGKLSTLVCLFMIATSCKILLFPAYRSTDFDVHRHWKALTHHLRLQEWYFDERHVETRHTLDYPPSFAYFESFWSNNPFTKLLLREFWLDPECLELLPDDELVVSEACATFLRSTVILSDLVLWVGAWFAASTSTTSRPWMVFALIVFNPGLLWLDHVHFQYNGFLLGILLMSIACLLKGNKERDEMMFSFYHISAAILFAVLLTLKHLYLTLSLWYFAYLLRRYCFVQDKHNRSVFSFYRLVLLGVPTLGTLLFPFFPFLLTINPTDQAERIATRLFPFARGLVHDYWAGNVWAFYMGADKVLGALLQRELPKVPPTRVALLLLFVLLLGAFQAWKAGGRQSNSHLLVSLTYSALGSFMVAYHVHEKAILTTLLPMILLVANDDRYSMLLWQSTAWGLLGLFPLLFEPRELLFKLSSYAAYMAAMGNFCLSETSRACVGLTTCAIVTVVLVLEAIPMHVWGRLAFLPLALTSLACATGLLCCWVRLTYLMIDKAKRS